jgi:hypothetical protein
MTTRETGRPRVGVPTSWLLRALDSDFTWHGLGRFRPAAKTERMRPAKVLALALITSVPFLLVTATLLLAAPVTPVVERSLLFIAIGASANLALQYWCAASWNQRASRLAVR